MIEDGVGSKSFVRGRGVGVQCWDGHESWQHKYGGPRLVLILIVSGKDTGCTGP